MDNNMDFEDCVAAPYSLMSIDASGAVAMSLDQGVNSINVAQNVPPPPPQPQHQPTGCYDNPTNPSYKQKYRKEWENEEIFKGWLRAYAPDQYKAYCKACNRAFGAHKTSLVSHGNSDAHKKNVTVQLEATTSNYPQDRRLRCHHIIQAIDDGAFTHQELVRIAKHAVAKL